MRICAVVKYPPIQGGVSALSYRIVTALAAAGHQASVVTNADEVEADYRMWMRPEDRARLEVSRPDGGSVSLVATSPLGRKFAAHIPESKPFVTKLAALATEEIRRIDADVVYSYYLEPYGLAAHLAAQWTGTPHVVQHAGSDRTRLLAHPDLSLAYREVLRRADLVIARPGTIECFGVDPTRVVDLRPRGLPAVFAEPDTPPLDINATVAELAAAGHPWITNTAPMPGDRASIGIYGKLSEYKGSYDLIAALARCKEAGQHFNFVVMAGGYQRARFLAAVRDAGLADCTWTLPFLPHWRVPEFLRSLTAACFLERRFPIAIHTPGVPAEVLSTGTCLVVSREISEKQRFRGDLRHGENGFLINEPSDVDELAAVLGRIAADPAAARRIGRAGRSLMGDGGTDAELAVAYQNLFQRVHRDTAGPAPDANAHLRLLRRFMPATAAVLGTSVDGIVERAGPHASTNTAHRTYAAAEAVVDWIRQQNDHLPLGTAVAAAFEMDLLWTHLDLESGDGGLLFPRRGASAMVLSDPVRIDARAPVTANGVRIRRYPVDIQAVLTSLRDGRTHAGTSDEEGTFLFAKRGDLDGQVRRIGPAIQALLGLCDGRTPVSAIADRLQRDHGMARADVEAHLVSLATDRVILM
jgi:glycosyltransferase involved in cell wall biosynthesis